MEALLSLYEGFRFSSRDGSQVKKQTTLYNIESNAWSEEVRARNLDL